MSNNAALPSVDLFLIVVVSAVFLVNTVFFARTFRHRSVSAMVAKLESTLGIAMPDERRPSIGRNIVRRQRVKIIVVFVAAAMMAFVVFSVDIPDVNYRTFLVVGLLLAGSVVGDAVGSLKWPPRRHDKTKVRVARAGAVSLNDYIPPFERRTMRIFVALAVAVYAFSLIGMAMRLPQFDALAPTRTSALFTGLAVLFLCFFEVVGRRIVGRAQPIGSEAELVWDDALRALDVRALAGTTATIAMLSVFFGFADLSIGLSDGLANTGLLIPLTVAGWIAFAAWAIMGIASMASHPERYFLLRLWPTYATTQPAVNANHTLDAEHTESRP